MAHNYVSDPALNAASVTGGGWIFPAVGAAVLAALWGAYTILVLVEIVSTPMPAM